MINKTITNQNGNEQLYIGINHDCLCNFISNCSTLALTLQLILLLLLTPILTLLLDPTLVINILSWNTLVTLEFNDYCL